MFRAVGTDLYIKQTNKKSVNSSLMSISKKSGAVIAGGYVNELLGGSAAADVDFFALNDIQFKSCKNLLEEVGVTFFHNSDWAMTGDLANSDIGSLNMADKIQIIKPQEGVETCEELADSFDFVNCSCWIDPANGNIFAHHERKDLELARELKVTNLNYPVITMKRMFKYSKKGYAIPINEMVKVLEAYSKCSAEKRAKEILRAGQQIYNMTEL